MIPDVLYHYTSNSALLSILKNKSLWLSAQWHLNDYAEGHVFNILVGELAEHLGLQPSSDRLESISSVGCYVNCLTQHEDMLSQWRGYAEDGKGVAIGIKKSALIDLINGSNEALLYPVEYADSLSDLSAEKRNLIEKTLKSDGSPSDDFLLALAKERWSVKGRGFLEEAEFRLMLTPRNPGSVVNFQSGARAVCNYRATSNNVREYYEIIFHSAAKHTFIDSIVLGPKNDSDLDSIKRLVEYYDFSDVNVKRSKTTYR